MIIGKLTPGYTYAFTLSETSSLLRCCCSHCYIPLRKKTVYLFIFINHYHYLLTKEMVPAVNGLFVCLFVCSFKIQRAYCLKSVRRICQRRRSQYLSLLCFDVYLLI